MNEQLWLQIREYVATEIKLAITRHEDLGHPLGGVVQRAQTTAALELMSSTLETRIRESCDG